MVQIEVIRARGLYIVQIKFIKNENGVTAIWRDIVMFLELLEGGDKFKMCAKSQRVYYSSKSCRLKRWKQHKITCDTITQLKDVKKASVCKSGIYNAALFPWERDQFVQLIGEKKSRSMQNEWCNYYPCYHRSGWWKNWQRPKVWELLDPCDSLRVHWGKYTEIPFLGWAD